MKRKADRPAPVGKRVGPVDVHQVLDASTSIAWNEIRHRAQLVREYGKDVPAVLGNDGRVGQVMLNLLVNAAQAMPDGRKPEPGGLESHPARGDDLAKEVDALRRAGVRFRSDVITGFGGKQILLDDPSGNPIELLEPRRG